MNVSHSTHSPEEAETWARALVMETGEDPDQLIGMPQAPRWKSWESYARLALLARDRIDAGAPLALQLDLAP